MTLTADTIRPEHVMAVDPWYWATQYRVKLGSGEYNLKGHAYQVEIMQSEDRKRVYKKAAQLGFTEIEILKTLHGMRYGKYPVGVMYLFPTADDVSDFTKARFNPLIKDNFDAIGQFVRDTDSATIKRINKSMLYLRGARSTSKVEGMKKDAAKLRSAPVDKLIFDERDLMEHEMVTLALERMSHSSVQERVEFSTPTIPDYGVDKTYQASDQRIWMLRCRKCRKEQCLELEFPNCILERSDGTRYRGCVKCGAELDPDNGRWVAQYPGKEWAGWWISQLNSAYVDPGYILDLFNDPPNGNIAEVYNSKLGMAYIAAENRLTMNDVYACCGLDAMESKSERINAMGVDVGTELNVLVGRLGNAGKIKVGYAARVSGFNDLHDIAQRFNVKACVMDMFPETRKCREFQAAESFDVWLCGYRDEMKGGELIDDRYQEMTAARTEICDRTHEIVAKAAIEFPRRSPEMEIVAQQMSSIAKVLEQKADTGLNVYRYRKLGPDHYRHSLNYLLLAIDRCRTAMESEERYIEARTYPKDYEDDDYNPLRFGLRERGARA